MANIGKVVVRPKSGTSISSPNYAPKLNVAIENVSSINVATRRNGDTLIYDASKGEYVSGPINTADIEISIINGGRF